MDSITKKIGFLALMFLMTASFLAAQTISFEHTESDEIIANPERGLQKYSITNATYYSTPNYSNINEATIQGWLTGPDKVSVIYRYFLMADFLNQDISDIYLENIQLDFDRIRNAGLKVIVRFSYSNRQSTDPQQPTKAQMLKHIEQVGPVLEANKDIIFSHQAGFLGTWGEWYYTNSTEFGTAGSISPTQWQNRKELIDAMLAHTPENIPIQVRYVQIKQVMYGTQPLTEETAYASTPNARIGFYNDAFLNNWADNGTYRVSGQFTDPVGSADYNFLSNETQFTPMTGETNGTNEPRTSGSNAVREMNLTNWTTINRDYYTPVVSGWIDSGHFPEIVKRLGYRFVLRNSAFTQNNATLSIELNLENVGFARVFKQRNLYLILKDIITEEEYTFLVPTDIRRWEDTVNIQADIHIASIQEGFYEVLLHLPDPLLPERPEYAIQFANVDMWDSNTGRNSLGFIDLEAPDVSTPETDSEESPRGLRLHQNYPNPFNPQTVIHFDLPEDGNVELSIYDLTGTKIARLRNEFFTAGSHQIVWNAGHLASGTYLVRLSALEQSKHVSVTLIK